MGSDHSDSGTRVMLLGLEGSGKSTFLKRLIESQYSQKVEPQLNPTVGFDYVSLKIKGQFLDIWDLGGDVISRKFWKTYYKAMKINFILYFIDLYKKETHIQSLKELIKLLNDEELKKCQVSIIFNCVLEKNVLDEKRREEAEQMKGKLIEKIREFPIYNYDTRIHEFVDDIITMNISDTFLYECFGVKES